MTPQQLNAMKLALEALELINIEFICRNGSHHKKEDRHEWDEDCPITNRWRKAITALEEALAEHAMQEVQRLGQEIEPDDIASILACRDMLDAQPVPPRTWVGSGDLEDSNAYLTTPQRTEQEIVATLLLQSKQNYERNFGPSAAADWIYSDLLELLGTTPPQRKPLTHEQRFDVLTKFEPHKHEWHAPAILIDLVEAAHNIKENT